MPEKQSVTSPIKTMNRFWDETRKIHIVKIMPGQHYVTAKHELISTLLGSCIAVCLRDKKNRVGGMNHFKLPGSSVQNANDGNYGMYAMEVLINDILKAGGKRQFLECSVFGGGNVVRSVTANIGERNIEFVRAFLKKENIPIIHEDVGHTTAQNVYFHPLSGNVFSVVNEESSAEEVKKAERDYMDRINKAMQGSSIIYFD